MACLMAGGTTKDCNYLLGGLNKLYLANISEIDSYTDTDPLDCIINAIVMVATEVFFVNEFDKNTGSATQELQVNNGQKFVAQTVSFSVASNNAALTCLLKDLSLGTIVAITEDRKGERKIMGRINGLEASVMTLNSGAADADYSGMTVTLTGSEPEWAEILDPAFDISTIL
jgi:hypothetical protein